MHLKHQTTPHELTDTGALELLRISGASPVLLRHCEAVRELALRICDRLSCPVDRNLVSTGALLHDLGRVRTQGILHVVEGARLGEELGLPDSICRIIQRHVGAGLSSEEAEQAGLPPGDYMPRTVEEKVVAYADNLVYQDQWIGFEKSLERFSKQLGPGNPVVQRMIALHKEVSSWCFTGDTGL